MQASRYLLCLDRYHLDDGLFMQQLARRFQQAGAQAPSTLLLHGSGERVERLLEGAGHFPERRDGVLAVASAEEQALLRRGLRETTRQIVNTLTDAVVAAAGFQGTDRGLLRLAPDGALQTGAAAWLRQLLGQRVVPVVASVAAQAEGTGPAAEVALAASAPALARALDAGAIVLLAKEQRAAGALPGAGRETMPVEALDNGLVPDSTLARTLAASGQRLLIANLDGFFASAGPRGTRVVT